MTACFSKSSSWITEVSISLQRAVVAADCTSGVWSAFMPLAKIFRIDFWRLASAITDVRRVGWVVKMSARIYMAVTWSASWPLLKQCRKRVRFSSARFCH